MLQIPTDVCVCVCVCVCVDGQMAKKVAIKKMDVTDKNQNDLMMEIELQRLSQHPNVVQFFEAFYFPTERELWVVLEFMGGGALTNIIEAYNEIQMKEFEIAYALSLSFASTHFAVYSRDLFACVCACVQLCGAGVLEGAGVPALAGPHPSRHQVRQLAHVRIR
jgi:hypothetical protein